MLVNIDKEKIPNEILTENEENSKEKIPVKKRKRATKDKLKEDALFDFSPSDAKINNDSARSKKSKGTEKSKKSKQKENRDLNVNKSALTKGIKWNEEENFQYLIANYIKHKYEKECNFKISWKNLNKACLIPSKNLEQINSHHQKAKKYFDKFNDLFESYSPLLQNSLLSKSDFVDVKKIKAAYDEIYDKIMESQFLEKLFNYDFKNNIHINIIIDFVKSEVNVVDRVKDHGVDIEKSSPGKEITKQKKGFVVQPINEYDNTKIIFSDDLNNFLEAKSEALDDENLGSGYTIRLDFNLILDYLKYKK